MGYLRVVHQAQISTCSILSPQITMSSANIIVHRDSCLTSSVNLSMKPYCCSQELRLLFIALINVSIIVESSIIGGNEVKPHFRPYMVSVHLRNKHTCGGFLIRHDYVLTAAHCVDNLVYSGNHKLEVVLGAHNISQEEPQQQRIAVEECIKHPCYKSNERPNDIMLLKLKSKAKLENDVQVIDLPKKNENLPANMICSIAGWGRTKRNRTSEVLREVNLTIQDNSECKRRWKDDFDTDSMICTTDQSGAFCKGDSGSPLICGKKPQGLAAFAHTDHCLHPNHPEVYMKVSYFLPWIKEIIHKREN
ncbi:granzyme B(G,H)-like [Tachysurus fulvidraco]|uniref:granzyme B(G,H)-like n=1 Tax=Tachysurus fulvidraco TaxID=1234273 RepID=UPI001FEE5BA6|nr:granzyme B(G,H)-like [Tachysurus fulvidraco]